MNVIEHMLYRGAAGEEQRGEIEDMLFRPLPGHAKRAPTQQERQKVHDEWASVMQQVG